MTRYVALLRGINVGKRRIKMDDLRAAFAGWEYAGVTTIQAAGNVLFEAGEDDPAALTAALEEQLEARYGFAVPVILRTHDQVRQLVTANPFAGIPVTKDTRLYVTFLEAPPADPPGLPTGAPGDDFRMLSLHGADVCSVLTLREGSRTVDAMALLEQTFGSRVTTRNWNTVQKIAAA